MHPLSGALPLPYVPMRVTRDALVLIGTRLRLLAAELLSTAEPFCSSQCLVLTFLVTLCLLVWDWRVEEQSHCFPVGRSCSFLLCPTVFSISSFHVLVV